MTTNSGSESNSQVFTFGAEVERMSKHQPIDIKPLWNVRWLTNGKDNSIFQRYKDAYDDSPTNASIINGIVSYIFGDGLVNKKEKITGTTPEERLESLKTNQAKISQYISEEDVQLICDDYKKYGGYAVQVIYSFLKVPLRIEYVPIYKLGIGFVEGTVEVEGYWFSWDWTNQTRYRPCFYPKFTGQFTDDQYLEIMVVKRPTSEPFFPVPDYFPALPWAEVEGELANAARNHFDNVFGALTVINYNNGKMADPKEAQKEADKVREKYCGSNKQAKTIVSFNESAEEAVTVDQLSPPELNQQNVFYAEEAERKIYVGHQVSSKLFSESNIGGGFSSQAEEIKVLEKVTYKRHIKPARKNIVGGLQGIFDMIPDADVILDLIDFDENEVATDTTQTEPPTP